MQYHKGSLMIHRREFLKKTGMMLGAGLVLPVISNVLSSCNTNSTSPVSSITVKISDYPVLANIGGASSVTNGGFNQGAPVIIVKTSATTFNTFSGICTHQGCSVDPPANNQVYCQCHGSIFSITDGRVLRGPANSALQKLSNNYNSTTDILTIGS